MLNKSSEMLINLKSKLAEGKPVYGIVLTSAATAFAEIAGLTGYDYAWIDMEHTSLDFKDVEQLIITLENTGCVPLVRVRFNESNSIGQVLDMGAGIVSIPHIDTIEDAKYAVRSAKYFPLGRRGYASSSRSTGHGIIKLDTTLMAKKNEETMLMVLIESEVAVANVDKIVQIDGVDAAFVGYADLCQDMGISPDPNHPKCADALKKVGEALKKAGKIGALVVPDPSTVRYYHKIGFSMILCGLDTRIMKTGAETLLKSYIS
ncbi:MAG: hypothetical protein JXB48_13210 [Candidatus Latescibacteria bacterium]|nr:hypothetical protein [Candidatus Latescibacterota bacterium]